MKKTVFLSLLALLFIFALSSCNIKTLEIKAKPTLSIPAGATSVEFSGYLKDIEKSITDSLPQATVTSKNPITIGFSKDLIDLDTNELFNSSEIDFGQVNQTISTGFTVPSIPPFNPINLELPSISASSLDLSEEMDRMDLPSSVTIPSISQPVFIPNGGGSIPDISLPVTGIDSFDTATFYSGRLNIKLKLVAPLNTSDELYVMLKVINKGSIIAPMFSYQNIADGLEKTFTLDLGNLTMDASDLQIQLSSITYSNTGVARDTSIDISFDFETASIKAATGLDFENIRNQTKYFKLGVASDAYATCTVNGNLTIDLSTPSEWTGVSKKFNIIVKQNSKVLVSATDVTSFPLQLDLSNKDLTTSDLRIEAKITMSGVNACLAFNSETKIESSFTPNIALTAVKDAKLALNETVTKPEALGTGTFKASSLIKILPSGVSVNGVTGEVSMGEDASSKVPLSIDSQGNIVADLSGKSITSDISFTVSKISLSNIVSSTPSVNPQFENIGFSQAEISQAGLAKKIDENVAIAQNVKDMVNSIKLKSGSIEITVQNGLPLSMDASITMNGLIAYAFKTFTRDATETWTIDLAGKTIPISEIDNFDVHFSAAPQGYINDRLTLTDIMTGQEYTLDATVNVTGIVIDNINVKNVQNSGLITDTGIDLSTVELLKNILIKDIPASITTSMDTAQQQNVDLTLDATYTSGRTNESKHVTLLNSQIALGNEQSTPLLLKDIINDLPKNLEIGYKIKTSESFDIAAGQKIKAGLSMSIPMEFEVTQDATITDDIVLTEDILGRTDSEKEKTMNSILSKVKELKLNFDLNNTLGMNAKIQVLTNDDNETLIKQIVVERGESNPVADLSDLVTQILEANPYTVKIRVVIPRTPENTYYSINGEGKIDLKFWALLGTDIVLPLNID